MQHHSVLLFPALSPCSRRNFISHIWMGLTSNPMQLHFCGLWLQKVPALQSSCWWWSWHTCPDRTSIWLLWFLIRSATAFIGATFISQAEGVGRHGTTSLSPILTPLQDNSYFSLQASSSSHFLSYYMDINTTHSTDFLENSWLCTIKIYFFHGSVWCAETFLRML